MSKPMVAVRSLALVMLVVACGTGDTKRSASSASSAPDSTAARADSGVRAPAGASVPVAPAPTPESTPRVEVVRPTAPVAKAPPATRGPRRVVIGGVDLTGVGYDQGSPSAPVVIVDFSDFACPYCAEFARETYPILAREYVATGKVLFKYVPFVAGPFAHAREATRVVECAAEQGRFWETLDLVYAAQREWKTASEPLEVLTRQAAAAGLDSARTAACYASGRTDARTRRATGVANDIGVRVTPSFLVNDRPVQGALPIADFRRVIEAALLVTQLKHE